MNHRNDPRPAFSRTFLGLLAFLSGWVLACGASDGTAAPSAEVILARDRAADYGARGSSTDWANARDVLEPIVRAKDAAAEDLLREANACLAPGEDNDRVEKALPLLERAERLAPGDPVLLWCRYRVAAIQLDNEAAVAILRDLIRLRPDDFTVRLALATSLADLGRPEAEAEAQQHFAGLLSIPAAQTNDWRVNMLYRRAQWLTQQRRDDEAAPLYDELNRLTASKVKGPGIPEHQPGTLGAIPPHTPTLFEVPSPTAPSNRLLEKRVVPAGAADGFRALRLSWGVHEEDLWEKRPADREELYTWEPPVPSFAVWGPDGLTLDGRNLIPGPIADALTIDRMNVGQHKGADGEPKLGDRDVDLLIAVPIGGGTELRLLENVGGQWSLRQKPVATLPPLQGAGHLTAVDYDHEGDVDVLATTTLGPRLLRNDGFDKDQGGFTDATAEANLPAGDFIAVCEEFDNDSDVDILWIDRSGGSPRLSSNLRGGRFEDATASLPQEIRGRFIVPADFDGDGWVDLAVFGDDLALYTRAGLDAWNSEVRRFPLASAPTGMPRVADWDLDGTNDLLWPSAEAPAAGLLAPGFAGGGLAFTLGERFSAPVPGEALLAVVELDGDLDLDLARLDPQGLRTWNSEGPGRGTRIGLFGHTDNSQGIGALIELRSGFRYRRLFYGGSSELIGFGGAPIDVVRITWPKGIVQGDFDFPLGSSTLIAQRPGLGGSCPFLYTWNGTTYEFISDVLGITPLGLPMAPGMPGAPALMVPPDHDEYVLVKGEQLVPKKGVYEMHFTEELREVTYLDRIRLDVIDHPADTEVFPNERFSFPPFPEAHTHTVRDPLVPRSAVDQTGKDWTRELGRDDRVFAVPFQPLTGPHRGLATPHTLELAYDPAHVNDATRLRLFLNGWFFWTDASVNMNAARHPEAEFIPPMLSVPDGEGGWRDCGPIGFPAGKLKTMAVDVTELLNRDDPRIRLFSTLRLYWDSIRLAVDADDAPLVTTALEPLSADLWQRGFSRGHMLAGGHDLEWFTWDELETEPRWNQHPGLYTKLGETLPLVSSIDDRFVILGAGDALTVRFDATKAPPLPEGWRRDFLVFLDGWAKDRDPNTLEALYVEPLPFHGMSGYPYRPDEHYPDDEEHRAYRREWNTRAATLWIDSIVPVLRGRTTSQTPAKESPAAAQ